MLREFVDRVLELAGPKTVMLDGRAYASQRENLTVIAPPDSVRTMNLQTLTGFVDAIRAEVDGLLAPEWVIVVEDHRTVSLVSLVTDLYGRRETLLTAKLTDGELFPFGRFHHREEFVIGLQSRFIQDEAVVELLRLASTLEASTVQLSEDDGISQRTTVKQGVALKTVEKVKGRVRLTPYRTFREVDQPASEFVFRLRSTDGEVPQCALFEADGAKWKLDAVLTIKAWLESKALGISVLA